MYAVGFDWDDHIRLRDTLSNIKGKFLLSYKSVIIKRENLCDCEKNAGDRENEKKEISVPKEDHDINKYFCVDAHPGLTDIFALQSRRLWRELGLFDKRYCLDNSKTLDYTGKILVIDPSVLHDEYKNGSSER